jgi:hypothetical protein
MIIDHSRNPWYAQHQITLCKTILACNYSSMRSKGAKGPDLSKQVEFQYGHFKPNSEASQLPLEVRAGYDPSSDIDVTDIMFQCPRNGNITTIDHADLVRKSYI